MGLRPTHGLGVVAVGLTVGAVAWEYAHVWRRGHAPLPTETDDVPAAAIEAGRETVEVAVAGYRSGSTRETAMLNLLVSYALTFGAARASTLVIRRTGSLGPLRNVIVRDRHIHHFIPGILLAFLAGGVSVVTRDESLDRWLAIPFGIGAALTFDEAALLIELEDVYWSEEGILSVQVALGGLAGLGAAAVGRKLLRRGEQQVLGAPAEGNRTTAS